MRRVGRSVSMAVEAHFREIVGTWLEMPWALGRSGAAGGRAGRRGAEHAFLEGRVAMLFLSSYFPLGPPCPFFSLPPNSKKRPREGASHSEHGPSTVAIDRVRRGVY